MGLAFDGMLFDAWFVLALGVVMVCCLGEGFGCERLGACWVGIGIPGVEVA